MTLLGYTRVSTDDQNSALQLDALRRAGVERTFSDDGVSGSRPAKERVAMAECLATAKRGDTIVAYSLSRVGRSTVDVLTLMSELDARGVAFRSLTEAIDTSTPVGRLLLSVLAAVAQFERELIVDRVRAGMAAARERGTHVGRPSSVSPERREAVLAAVRAGMSVAEAARLAGVSDSAARRLVAGTKEA